MTAREWTIRLPYATPPLSLNQRLHWARENRLKRDVAEAVTAGVRKARVPRCEAIHVRLVYVPRDRRTRDADNLVRTLKPCLDAIVRAGIVPDDSPQYVTWAPPEIALPDRADPHLYLLIERTA